MDLMLEFGLNKKKFMAWNGTRDHGVKGLFGTAPCSSSTVELVFIF
jgi:hypothetical protein